MALDPEALLARSSELDEWGRALLPDAPAGRGRRGAHLGSRPGGTPRVGPMQYVSHIEPSAAAADLRTVEGPLAHVAAGDSAVVIRSAQFDTHPLVISGRGGGPAATAAGLLADVASIVRADDLGEPQGGVLSEACGRW